MSQPETKSNPAAMRASAPVMARPHFRVWLMAVLLVLVTIVLYWPATRHGFVNYDDPIYVTDNSHVQGGLNWEGVKWAFGNTEQGAYWAPLMWLSHMLACQLFGLNAWGHHLVNVLLHAANTALVFLVFRRMTGATWRSLMLAALFGLHPLRVESVAWITERKDVLSTLFWMLTLWAYVKYVEAAEVRNSKSSRWYGTALAMFALGLMSKAMLVTLPFVLLLLDYWPLGRFKPSTLNPQPSTIWRLVTEKIPFFALAAAASVVTFMVQKHGGTMAPVENLPLGARAGNALISYCRYLGKLFWPADLAVFYPHPGYWPMEQVLLAGGLMAGISVFLFVQRRQYPFLLVGWLWFCGTLVPVIQLVQSGGQAMADRFTYVPSLGLLILVIWGAYEPTRRWRYQVIVLSAAGTAAIVLCIGLTRQQLRHWNSGEALFRHALEVTENNYLAHDLLAAELNAKGRYDEAIEQLQEALKLKPNIAELHYHLGITFEDKGQGDEAILQFQKAVELNPNHLVACNDLGMALARKGLTDEAIQQFQRALRLAPGAANIHYNLGNAFAKAGRWDEAAGQFQEALRLQPEDASMHNNLGAVLFQNKRTAEAIQQFQAALKLKPDYASARTNLATALKVQMASPQPPGTPAKP